MTRNFSSTLLFETALDTIQPNNSILYSISQSLFKPTVKIVEEDCETLLGKLMPISYRTEGYIELSTSTRVNSTRLTNLITSGETEIAIRSIDTCISYGGICRSCLASSRPAEIIPAVNSVYRVIPEVVLDTSQFAVFLGQQTINLPYNTDVFDFVYMFQNGELVPSSTYNITGNTLTFNEPAPMDTILILKYMVRSFNQFYSWLANTYCGSLLGIKPIYKTTLPIKKELLRSVIPEEDLKTLISNLKTSIVKEEDSVQYIDSIKDPVEKAIFSILLGSVFLSN